MNEAYLNWSGPTPGITLFSAGQENCTVLSKSKTKLMIVQVKATGQQKMEEEEEDEGNDQLQHTRPNCEDAGLGRIDYGTKLFDSKWSSQVRNSKGASLHI